MKESDLPQVCARCHKQKAANTGRFFWSRTRYHTRVWVCFECLDRPKILRLARPGEETPLEKEAREALEQLHVKAFAEYPIGRFIFDFAIPKLRMLIEIDSVTYHRRWHNMLADKRKNEWAQKNLWHLVRIRAPDIAQQVVHAVMKRAQELR